MTRLPMILALLPLVVLPAAAYREALGNPNATFRVRLGWWGVGEESWSSEMMIDGSRR